MNAVSTPKNGQLRSTPTGGQEVFGDSKRLTASESSPESRIRLVPFQEIRLSPQRRDLVKGIIPRIGLTLVWGPPKCGKSFWTFDMSMHVALGRDYRGRRVHAGPVIYCAFEGQSGMEARIEAWRQRHLAEDTGDVPFYLEPVTINLVADHLELISVIRRQTPGSPVLVVLDTLNRSLAGSESSDEDMSAYVRAADAIRAAFQCAVVIVHHCGHDGSRPRGHTALPGAIDAQIAVKRDGADNIIAAIELMKDGPQGDEILSRLEQIEVGVDEDGEAITSCIICPVERASRPEPRQTKQSKLSNPEALALQAILFLVDNSQTVAAPALPGVPAGTMAVRMADARAQAYQAGFAGQDELQDTVKKRWNRAVEGLLAKGRIRQDTGLAWPV